MRFPTTRETAGDFSQTLRFSGSHVVIYDPLTGDANGNGRTPFPGNIIPANRINPVAVEDGELPPDADARRQQRQQQLRHASPRSTTAP